VRLLFKSPEDSRDEERFWVSCLRDSEERDTLPEWAIEMFWSFTMIYFTSDSTVEVCTSVVAVSIIWTVSDLSWELMVVTV